MSQRQNPTGEFLNALMQAFQREKVNVDVENLADMLWLATQASPEPPLVSETDEQQTPPGTSGETQRTDVERSSSTLPPAPTVPLTVPRPRRRAGTTTQSGEVMGPTVIAPSAPPLRDSLNLGRSFRPLMRKVASRVQVQLNEEATAIRIAEQPQGWMPVLEPSPERWLSVSLVVENSRTVGLWQDIIDEFRLLLARQGAFQTVRCWRLNASATGQIQLFSKLHIPIEQQQPRPPQELADPGGRHLVLLVSDAMSDLWSSPTFYKCLQDWSKVGPVALLQLLPERIWQRSALGLGVLAQLSSWLPGVTNPQLDSWLLSPLDEIDTSTALKLPVITLQPEPILQWANVVAGSGGTRTAGVLFEAFIQSDLGQRRDSAESERPLTDQERVNRFRAIASPIARRLAVLMSMVPVSLPVIYLIQQTCIPEATQVHIAEVFMGGVLEPESSPRQEVSPDMRYYEFIGEIRAILNQGIPRSQVDDLLDAVSEYISVKAGLTTRTFTAILSHQARSGEESENVDVREFARITRDVLHRLGGSHRAWVESIDRVLVASETAQIEEFDLREFEYEAAKVSFPDSQSEPMLRFQTLDVGWLEIESDSELQTFEFEAATIEQRNKKWVIQRRSGEGQQFVETLAEGITLDMVAIPAGTFIMGSPKNELERFYDEQPQHQVQLSAFFMAKSPVTQAQWRVIAELPQIERELDPSPSYFKGDDRPVEQVNWHEAMEFCSRLSAKTGRTYTLPTEAQWEYACRSGTEAPFYFGEMITAELANYSSDESYNGGPIASRPGETTPVGQYPANLFGLWDMHGNVWEWCLDHWYDNYEGAPKNGSAWLSPKEDAPRVLRGGSWYFNPRHCRSAARYYNPPGARDDTYGFRVVCLPQDFS